MTATATSIRGSFEETIEVPSPKKGNPTHIEPQSQTDYSIWERKYGKPLSDCDKLEIKANLTDFFLLLKEEWERKAG